MYTIEETSCFEDEGHAALVAVGESKSERFRGVTRRDSTPPAKSEVYSGYFFLLGSPGCGGMEGVYWFPLRCARRFRHKPDGTSFGAVFTMHRVTEVIVSFAFVNLFILIAGVCCCMLLSSIMVRRSFFHVV